MIVRCDAWRCDGRYEVTFDSLGRMQRNCPACARRRAGICATCNSPVVGKVPVAKYCTPCREAAHRRDHKRYVANDVKGYNRRAAARVRKVREIKRNGRPVLDQKTIGTIRGLARAKALSPERRAEISRIAANTRWAKYRQREMLRRMREQQG